LAAGCRACDTTDDLACIGLIYATLALLRAAGAQRNGCQEGQGKAGSFPGADSEHDVSLRVEHMDEGCKRHATGLLKSLIVKASTTEKGPVPGALFLSLLVG